jgi:N utilization substance protein B
VSTSPGPDGLSSRRTPTGARRRARERALELLYEAESKDLAPAQLLSELPVAPEEYAARLVLGVERRAEEVNSLLGRHATGWSVERMPMVDRCLLKMAVFELLDEPDVPVAVVLDEAVELAKSYSTEDSGRYVNGVLSAVATQVRGKVPENTGTARLDSLE